MSRQLEYFPRVHRPSIAVTSKNWTLLAVVLAAVGLCIYINRDWFRSERIQIYHRLLPTALTRFRGRKALASGTVPLMFGFDRKLKLTSVEVLPMWEIETNKFPQPVWHLVSDSNSVPTKGFVYGMNVPGMRPAVKGLNPYPLEPGVKYRLVIQAGTIKAEHDFALEPPAQ